MFDGVAIAERQIIFSVVVEVGDIDIEHVPVSWSVKNACCGRNS